MFNFDLNDLRRKPIFGTGVIYPIETATTFGKSTFSYSPLLKLNCKNILGRYAGVNRH